MERRDPDLRDMFRSLCAKEKSAKKIVGDAAVVRKYRIESSSEDESKADLIIPKEEKDEVSDQRRSNDDRIENEQVLNNEDEALGRQGENVESDVKVEGENEAKSGNAIKNEERAHVYLKIDATKKLSLAVFCRNFFVRHNRNPKFRDVKKEFL